MTNPTAKSYSMDPTLWLYTSLTSGSSHIITATSRMETILKANRIPFKALDIATDEKARMLWGRRAGKDVSGRQRKIPGLVQMGMVIGDIVEVEDWNEYGELKQHLNIVPISGVPVPPIIKPYKVGKVDNCIKKGESMKITVANDIKPLTEIDTLDIKDENPIKKKDEICEPKTSPISLAMRKLGLEAAMKVKADKKAHKAAIDSTREAKLPKQDSTDVEQSWMDKVEHTSNAESEETKVYPDKKSWLEEESNLENKNRIENYESSKCTKIANEMVFHTKKAKYETKDSTDDISEHEGIDQLCESGCKKKKLLNTTIEPDKQQLDSIFGNSSATDSISLKKPSKETLKRPAAILPPDSIYIHNILNSAVDDSISPQTSNSNPWKNSIIQFASLQPQADRLESVQSPNSTAWKPASLDQTLREVVLAGQTGEVANKTKENK